MTDHGMAIDATLTSGNLGLLKGQGHLAVALMPRRESPLNLRRHGAPSSVEISERGDSVRLLGNSLSRQADGWLLEVREGREALDATIQLQAVENMPAERLSPMTMVSGERQWIVGCEMPRANLNGAWRSGLRGDLLRGEAILLRRAGDALPGPELDRLSIYAFDPSFVLGIERTGEQVFAWFSDDSGTRQTRKVEIREQEGALRFDLSPEIPVKGSVLLKREPLVVYPWDHLLGLEQYFVRKTWGTPTRQLHLAIGRLDVAGIELETRTLVARTVYQDIAPPEREILSAAPPAAPPEPQADPAARFRPPCAVAPTRRTGTPKKSGD